MQFFHTSFALLQIDYEIKWSIKAKGHAFSSGGRACDLCLTEKLVILTSDQNSTLNKRDELLEICRQWRKHLLVSLVKKKESPDAIIKYLSIFFKNTSKTFQLDSNLIQIQFQIQIQISHLFPNKQKNK